MPPTQPPTGQQQKSPGRPPKRKFLADGLKFSIGEFSEERTADDGRTYLQTSFSLSKSIRDHAGNVTYQKLTVFPNELPGLLLLLETVCRESVVRIESNGRTRNTTRTTSESVSVSETQPKENEDQF